MAFMGAPVFAAENIEKCIDKGMMGAPCVRQCMDIYGSRGLERAAYSKGHIILKNTVIDIENIIFPQTQSSHELPTGRIRLLVMSIIDCVEYLTATEISEIKEIHEILRKPALDKLDRIDEYLFELYVSIDFVPLRSLIQKYSPEQSKAFLYWSMSNETAFNEVYYTDWKYKNFKLLKSIIADNPFPEVYTPFLEKIRIPGNQEQRLIEVMIDSGNDDVMVWFQKYIETDSKECRADSKNKDCFQVFCKVGSQLDKNRRKKWIELSGGVFNLERYLEGIIKAKTNAVNGSFWGGHRGIGWTYGSGPNQLESLNDLGADWVSALCKGLY